MDSLEITPAADSEISRIGNSNPMPNARIVKITNPTYLSTVSSGLRARRRLRARRGLRARRRPRRRRLLGPVGGRRRTGRARADGADVVPDALLGASHGALHVGGAADAGRRATELGGGLAHVVVH